MNFEFLVSSINKTHQDFQQSAIKAINVHMTIRNWLIGFYIVEFEQNGEDKAKYGSRLLDELASFLSVKGLSARNLKLFRQFYFEYPQIVQTVSAQLKQIGLNLQINEKYSRQLKPIYEALKEGAQSAHGQTENKIISGVKAKILVSKLSFSHFSLLLPIKDPMKRTFYEIETIKGSWSINELKRQINTLYFERSGISKKPDLLRSLTNGKSEKGNFKNILKSPFTFEFLGLKSKDVVYESDLEQALIDNLEEFLLELGHGFCFEAKQKRIVIGDEYYFVDLVFYHRILKCHVLIELKTDEVKHEHIGQLKTYINYYKKEVMLDNDNPPVGLLLVTQNKKALVEYAVADSDLSLFVSKYLLELPSKEQLEEFISNELDSL